MGLSESDNSVGSLNPLDNAIMLLGEPPSTQADVHLRILGFPVRIHPFFWIVALVLGMGGLSSDRRAEPVETLLRVAVVLVSILVHELGHAVMQRRYGGHPWITLYALGGLASCDDCDRRPRSQVIISAAGPLAGFLLVLAVIVAVRLTGHAIGLLPPGWQINDAGLNTLPLVVCQVYWEPFSSHRLTVVIVTLLAINILWGLLNLLPIYPLDGGRIARELFTLGSNPRQGILRSLWLSAGVSAVVAVYGLTQNSIFMLIMFGLLAYQNYQSIQAYQDYGAGRSW